MRGVLSGVLLGLLMSGVVWAQVLEVVEPTLAEEAQEVVEERDRVGELRDLVAGALPRLREAGTPPGDLLALAGRAERLADVLREPEDRLMAETLRAAAYYRLARQAVERDLASVAGFRLAQVRGVAGRMETLDTAEADHLASVWRLLAELGESEAAGDPRGDRLASLLLYLSESVDTARTNAVNQVLNSFETQVFVRTVALQLEQGNGRAAAALAGPLIARGATDPTLAGAVMIRSRLDQAASPVLRRALEMRTPSDELRIHAAVFWPWGRALDAGVLAALERLRAVRGMLPIEVRVVVVGGVVRPASLEGWDGAQGWVSGEEVLSLEAAGLVRVPAYVVVDERGILSAIGTGPETLERAAMLGGELPAEEVEGASEGLDSRGVAPESGLGGVIGSGGADGPIEESEELFVLPVAE
ncbi:MAG: hypothetical protein RLN76_01245 [Phycisphaeraceae bacterium]